MISIKQSKDSDLIKELQFQISGNGNDTDPKMSLVNNTVDKKGLFDVYRVGTKKSRLQKSKQNLWDDKAPRYEDRERTWDSVMSKTNIYQFSQPFQCNDEISEERNLRRIEAQIRRKNRNRELQAKKRRTLIEINVNTGPTKLSNDRTKCSTEDTDCPSKGDLSINDLEKSIEHYRRYATRFSRDQIVSLNRWYDENRHNPYASDSTVRMLSEKTGIEVKSIRKWLSNKRTRLLETRTFRK